MKKLTALLLALTLLLPGLAQADFDTKALLTQEGVIESMNAQLDTVYSLPNPFYMGEVDDGTLLVTLDYVHKTGWT